jgi:hypothetical protein
MIPEIFDIVSGKIVVNENVLLIPELKAVHDKYKDPIPALSFLHYKYSPKGPYCNTPEADKDDILLLDFPGEYTLEDKEMIKAMEKLASFMMSPTYRYYLDNKILLEKMGKFGRMATVTSGRDGNASVLNSQLSKVGKTISEFKQLEKVVQQELDEHKSRVRGEKRKAYDQ